MIGKPKKTPIKIPEAVIQKQVESYLRLKRIPYFRVPDSVYRNIKSMGKRGAIEASSSLKGLPDLMIFKVTPDGSTICLPLELKTANGKLTDTQKMWQEKIGTKVARSLEEAVNLIESFWTRSA